MTAPRPPSEQDVRSPRLAILGVVLVVATVLTAAVFVVIAITRIGDDASGDPNLRPEAPRAANLRPEPAD